MIAVAAAGAVAVWSATDPGSYGPSGNGCVTVVFASSMGGAMQHACGEQARTWCRTAYSHDDRLALLTRPQCQLAGI